MQVCSSTGRAGRGKPVVAPRCEDPRPAGTPRRGAFPAGRPGAGRRPGGRLPRRGEQRGRCGHHRGVADRAAAWSQCAPAALHNLVLLCGAHHRLIHHHGWQVRLRPDTGLPRFRAPRWIDPDQTTRPRWRPASCATNPYGREAGGIQSTQRITMPLPPHERPRQPAPQSAAL